MSDWRPKQRPATFRGVPFHVDAGEQSGGRQTVNHEYPLSEAPDFTEDLGKKALDFTVECYVIGTEYEAARDALLSALEKPGPGELVHPYFGTRQVAVLTYRMRQQRADGGMATFSINFHETSATPATPTVTVDARGALAVKVAAANAAAKAQFGAVYGSAPFVGDFSRMESFEALQAVDAMTSILDALPIAPAARAAFALALTTSPAEGMTLADYIPSVFVTLFDALGVAFATVTGPINPAALFLRVFDFDPGTRPPGTAGSQALNQAKFDAIQRLVQRYAITYACAAASVQVFDSFDAAVETRNLIADVIDQHVEAVTDDSFGAITDLRAALVAAVPGPDSDLPSLQTYTPAVTVPSLVLSHRLYGDLEHEADMLARNRIGNPGFIAGGVPLEVLTK
jgi:prophage DNA circulation protein